MIADHYGRLTAELRDAAPTTIVTLGNAALRVLRELVPDAEAVEPRLSPDHYGRRLLIDVNGRSVAWYPLVHPGGRGPVKQAHSEWTALRSDREVVAARGLCPACRGRGLVPILYGMPAPEAMEDARRGRLAIGGCIVADENPELHCVECGSDVHADGTFDVQEW